MPTIAIVGAGLIGRAWAGVFARGGWEVRVTDPSREVLESVPRLIRESLDEQAALGLAQDPARAAERVAVMPSLAEAVAQADLVQESGPETVEAKQAIFAELDRFAPAYAILASSTSFIVASRFTEDLPGRGRCLIAHPVNPPHLVPIVEQLFESFDRLRTEVSIVIVDHHLDLALALSDRTVALERGRVIHTGPSKDLRDDLALRRKVLWL